ncbi:MAG: hypothetical protein QM789_01205 [Paenirhodobacter sp.]
MVDISRSEKLLAPTQKLGRRHHHLRRIGQIFRRDAGPMPVAETDTQIRPRLPQVDHPLFRQERQRNFRVPLPEPRQPRHQPFRREGRGQGDGERLFRVMGAQPLDRGLDHQEPVRQRGGQPFTLGRQMQHPPIAPDQRHAQIGLQRADLLLNRSVGYIQPTGGRAEATLARGGGKGTQGRQRRHMFPVDVTHLLGSLTYPEEFLTRKMFSERTNRHHQMERGIEK